MEYFLLWSLWCCSLASARTISPPPGNQLVTIPGHFLPWSYLSQSSGYDLIVILAWPCHYLMSSKLTQSYEDNLIVENQTNSFLFSNLLNNHHRNDLPFVKGVSNSNYIPDSYFYRILKRVWIHLHNVPPFSFLDINMFCSNTRTINIYDFW